MNHDAPAGLMGPRLRASTVSICEELSRYVSLMYDVIDAGGLGERQIEIIYRMKNEARRICRFGLDIRDASDQGIPVSDKAHADFVADLEAFHQMATELAKSLRRDNPIK